MKAGDFNRWLKWHAERHPHPQWRSIIDRSTQEWATLMEEWEAKLDQIGATLELLKAVTRKMVGDEATPEWPKLHLPRVLSLARVIQEQQARDSAHAQAQRSRLASAAFEGYLEAERPRYEALSPPERQALWDQACAREPDLRHLEGQSRAAYWIERQCLIVLAELETVTIE